jgi:2-polyprenyl-6-methoxyphenol hydroxylase-like FAD-dependent oxidoreductase
MVVDQTAELSFDTGLSERFDLVVFADGHRSLGRRLLFPKVDTAYSGYILWLGLYDEADMADSAPLEGVMARVKLAETGGHVVFHFLPGPDGSVLKGRRRVNWSCAIPLPADQLSEHLAGANGRRQAGFLPPGQVHPAIERRLKDLVGSQLPAFYAGLVSDTSDTAIQPVYRVEMPAYHRRRLCLIGDAGELTPPLSSSGVFKGTGNAIDLAAALQEVGDVEAALAEWGRAQTVASRRLAAVARQMEDALVWDMPDLAVMDEVMAAAWWQNAVTFPDEFAYNEAD